MASWRHSTAATPPRLLPTELTDKILLELHDDPSALGACALVSRSWLPRARHLRFHSITVTPRTAGSLSALLVRSPGLAPYIRALELTKTDHTGVPVRARWRAAECGFLAQLPAVTRVAVCTHGLDALLDALALPDALPRVTRLDIARAGFYTQGELTRLVGAFPRLDALTWGNVLVMDPVALEDAPGAPPALRELTMHSADFHFEAGVPFLGWLLRGPARTTLSSLEFRVSSTHDAGVLADALAKVGPVLRHLALTFDCAYAPLEDIVVRSMPGLAACAVIKSCSCVFSVDDAALGGGASLACVPQLLARLSSGMLEAVSLEFRAGASPLGSMTVTFDQLCALDWERVESALGRAPCDELRAVRVCAAGCSATLEERLAQRCPGLVHRKLLSFVQK